MLQKIIEYLVNNPDVKEKVKNGQVNLIGLSRMEQKAVLDVLRGSGSSGSPMQYW
jgi:competence protein ComX